MRARLPDTDDTVTAPDGTPIHYEVFGTGDPTLVLVPPAPITHARMYKAMVPFLARRHRVVTLDCRGNGGSGRPTEPGAHTRAANEADIVAIMDACEVNEAVLVAHCHANWWALDVATDHPGRVIGLVALAPGVPHLGSSQPHWVAMGSRWDEPIKEPVGWELATRTGMVDHHRRWVEFFFDQQLVEDHSTKHYEDMVGWALESTGEVLAAAEEGIEIDAPSEAAIRARCQRLDVPVLVVHGERDVCQSVDRGRAFAELVGAELVLVQGGGHLVAARDPVTVNNAIADFLERRMPVGDTATSLPAHRTWPRGATRPRRVLYLSSPIGLGHARRDVAIARHLLDSVEGLEVDWLAQDPVTRVLHDEGLHVHPASAWLASESAHLTSEASGHRLDCFEALRRMDEILVANFMVFQEVVDEGHYDLVIGDEAWDVDRHWHENPELKRSAHVWLTDFVGYLPMHRDPAEARLTADYNAEMIELVERFPRVRDRALFVGNPDDVVADRFGPGLPRIADWTRAHFDFTGYVTGFTPPEPDDIARWRHEFGWDDARVVVAAVGGSGIGGTLLTRIIEAFAVARHAEPELRLLAVAGPRIDPASLPRVPGLEVRGYVDRLYRHLAACDLAVVQGGLTTTMELAAARRPFLYFPLRDHFEQNIHVRHRLDQYRAGRCMDFATSSPDAIAAAMLAELGAEVDSRPVESDGAARAAAIIRELL